MNYQIPILSLKKSSKHHKHFIISLNNLNNASTKLYFFKMIKLSIIGNGYTTQFLSREALKKGVQVSIITRNISKPKKNIHYFNYYDSKNIAEKLSKENIISTVPPNEEGLDPVIQKYRKSIASNKNKIIYFSATSVYGEGETDEETKPDPKHNRGIIRLNAEEEWIKTNQKTSIFRIAGIYGPKRHPMIKYLEGNNEILVKKDYIPNRIHVEDLSSIAIKFVIENLNNKIINVCDQNKVSSYEAVKYVTDKLKLKEPLIIKYNPNQVSDSLKSFYETNRIIKCKVLGNELKYKYKYPDYSKALLNLTKKLIKNK